MARPVGHRGKAFGILRLTLAAAAFAALPLLAFAVDELRFFRIGTAAPNGTYFQIGGVLASAISKPPGARDCERGGSCGVPGLVAVAQASQGSVQNALMIGAGDIESGLIQSDVAYWAQTGTGVAAKRCTAGKQEPARPDGLVLLRKSGAIANLRAIAALYPEDVHVVVRADSTLRALRDLKGKRVAMGEPESGTLADARLLLEAAGIGECEVKAAYLRLADAADALVAGRIDAFFMVGGYPVPAITDVAASVPIRLLPIPRELATKLAAQYPFFSPNVIPAGVYPGLDRDTATLSTTAIWTTRADLDEDLVYAITKSLWSDATRRLLDASHPAGQRIRLATALDGLTIPLHPGAARYYHEAGIRIPNGL